MFKSLFAWFWGLLKTSLIAMLSWFRTGFDNIWNGLLDLLSIYTDALIAMLPPALKTYFSANWWSPITSAAGVVSYFIPIYGMLALGGAALTVVAYIRLVRWVKSFIPTIGD